MIDIFVQLLADRTIDLSTVIVLSLRSVSLVQITHVHIRLIVITNVIERFSSTITLLLILVAAFVGKRIEFRTGFRIRRYRFPYTKYLLRLIFWFISIFISIFISFFIFLVARLDIMLDCFLISLANKWVDVHVIIDSFVDHFIENIDNDFVLILVLSVLINITINDLLFMMAMINRSINILGSIC